MYHVRGAFCSPLSIDANKTRGCMCATHVYACVRCHRTTCSPPAAFRLDSFQSRVCSRHHQHHCRVEADRSQSLSLGRSSSSSHQHRKGESRVMQDCVNLCAAIAHVPFFFIRKIQKKNYLFIKRPFSSVLCPSVHHFNRAYSYMHVRSSLYRCFECTFGVRGSYFSLFM